MHVYVFVEENIGAKLWKEILRVSLDLLYLAISYIVDANAGALHAARMILISAIPKVN